jgi:hypothetical protein
VGVEKLHRILRVLRSLPELLRNFAGPLQLGAQEIEEPKSKLTKKKFRGIAQSLTKLPRASIGTLDFRRVRPLEAEKDGPTANWSSNSLCARSGVSESFCKQI